MDILDNLIYATVASPLEPVISSTIPADPRIMSNYITEFTLSPLYPNPVGSIAAPVYSYTDEDKFEFCAYADSSAIESSVLRHWYDIGNKVNYDSDGRTLSGTTANIRYSSFQDSSPYHLIYGYLLENTRMLQIFERLLNKYFQDEELGIADNELAFNWLQNSEKLFFKSDILDIRSLIRPSSDLSRRNAYWRMFGMDLAFGDSGNEAVTYHKAKTSNQQFIVLFEKYLSEIWQSYTNANNSSGVNTSDINVIVDLATQLREMLIARRGSASSYVNQNLSREEYTSVLINSWFAFIISYDSEVVQFLKCQSSTIGERLIKIGNRVGIPGHSKCQSLFEMAGAASSILKTIEIGGTMDDPSVMQNILKSLVPPTDPNVTSEMNFMTDFLTVINNWEKATGHRIKNPEANIRGTATVAQSQKTNGKALTQSYT